jgi:hypothetical protein
MTEPTLTLPEPIVMHASEIETTAEFKVNASNSRVTVFRCQY